MKWIWFLFEVMILWFKEKFFIVWYIVYNCRCSKPTSRIINFNEVFLSTKLSTVTALNMNHTKYRVRRAAELRLTTCIHWSDYLQALTIAKSCCKWIANHFHSHLGQIFFSFRNHFSVNVHFNALHRLLLLSV